MKTIIALFLIFGTSYLSAQNTRSFLFGSEFSGKYINQVDPQTHEQFTWAYYTFAPYLAYFVKDYLAFGITGEYDVKRIQKITIDKYHGLGIFAKTIIPIFPKRNDIMKCFFFAGEVSYLKTDNYYENGQVFHIQNQDLFKLSSGLTLRLWNRIHLEIAYAPRYYIGKGLVQDGRLNIEYHFKNFKK